MRQFLKNYSVYLTPLTPIHIGCGEDFEPTNYTIDGGVLYHFNPSQLAFSATDRKELMQLAEKADLLAIQRFFANKKPLAIASAHYFSEVSNGIENLWQERVGKVAQRESNGNEVICKLAIERTSYLPYQPLPYIPGSSFKGAMATALLDQEHKKAKALKPQNARTANKDFVKQFIGEFKESKLRQIKFSDFMPNESVNSKIYFSVNFKKNPKPNSGNSRGIPLRRECISAGQYRAFSSYLAIWENDKSFSLSECLKSLNQYYLSAFIKEMKLLLERKLISKAFFSSLVSLLDKTFKSYKNIALIRLGKSGADSKVYSTEGIAEIKIMQGKGNRPRYLDHSTTVWLAGENDKQTTNLLPFGWALIEITPEADNALLKEWCEQQPKSSFDKATIFAQRKAELEAKKREEEDKARQEALRIAEEEAKSTFFAQLNENQKRVFDLVEQFKNGREIQFDLNSVLLKAVLALFNDAVASWTVEERHFVTEHLTPDLINSRIEFKKKDGEKNFQKQYNKLKNNAV